MMTKPDLNTVLDEFMEVNKRMGKLDVNNMSEMEMLILVSKYERVIKSIKDLTDFAKVVLVKDAMIKNKDSR